MNFTSSVLAGVSSTLSSLFVSSFVPSGVAFNAVLILMADCYKPVLPGIYPGAIVFFLANKFWAVAETYGA